MKLTTVALGPELNRPTWSWVGFNLARELSKYYKVIIYREDEHPEADVIISVKQPPLFLSESDWERSKVIFLPHDYFGHESSFLTDPLIPRYSAIVVHSYHLFSTFRNQYPNAQLCYLPHDDKYVLRQNGAYRSDGFVLWVGFARYVPYLAEWLASHPLDLRVVVLTDKPNNTFVPGVVEQLRWTPQRQQRMMSEAKAALDIKGDEFSQRNKSLEKLDTFIASGIPCASNEWIVQEYRNRGFDMAIASDTSRWFSSEYFMETVRFSKFLREQMSLCSVGSTLQHVIESIL